MNATQKLMDYFDANLVRLNSSLNKTNASLCDENACKEELECVDVPSRKCRKYV